MADGLNEARAYKITELLQDYHAIHQQIAQLQVNPPPFQAQAHGFIVLNQCHAAAQALLVNLPPNPGHQPANLNDEQIRVQLQGVILDAASRRFRAQMILRRALACRNWVQRRTQLLQGQPPNANHTAGLNQIDARLNQELAAVTNQLVFNELHQRDVARGYWVAQMPGLQALLVYIQAHP